MSSFAPRPYSLRGTTPEYFSVNKYFGIPPAEDKRRSSIGGYCSSETPGDDESRSSRQQPKKNTDIAFVETRVGAGGGN